MKKTSFVFFFLILAAVSLACSTFQNINQGRQTAQAVVTEFQGLATQGGSLLTTARAFATENPSTVQTAQSFLTTQGPALRDTAQAFATQNPGALETAKALVTNVPGAVETMGSDVIGGSTSPLHPDIPVLPESQRDTFFETDTSIFYSTASLTRKGVEDYYLSEMPNYGWLYDPDSSSSTDLSTIQTYRKDSRQVQVIILPVAGTDTISITINIAQ